MKKCRDEKQLPKTIKKNVSFADTLGLDLECRIHFQNYPDEEPRETKIVAKENVETFLKAKFLLPPQEIMDLLVVKEKVRLESITVSAFIISGVVRVANIHFEKEVLVQVFTNDASACYE